MAYAEISSITRLTSDTLAELPTTYNAGSTALVDADKQNYVFNGTAWKKAPMPIINNGVQVANETGKSVTADTDVLTDYTAETNESSLLLVLTDTEGVLSLILDDVSGCLNDGDSLEASKWYAFEIPVTSGSTYNLQFSVDSTLQIKWVVR